ncbi:MAG TPA: LacI family DNA-binding transcriptional regulator [Nocardioidaceae bacterium]|nr:LacI family DNA-binding transcriptional regulator [Nocardioidaceae bacterium]
MTVSAQRVTIADVARTAGVSVPTVSKVLNHRADVSSDTRERVQQAISSHGYRRRTRSGRPRAALVDLVVAELDSPYFLEVLTGAEQAAARAGVGLVVTSAHGHEPRGGDWLATLTARRSSGIVMVVSVFDSSTLARLADLATPLVLLDPVGGSDPTLPTVGATNWSGGLAATEHLLSLGHRRVAVITGPPELVCSQERLEGYRAAMGRAGIAVDDDLVRFGDFQPDGGQRAAAELLALPDPPTAIFAGSDMQASGVYQEARAHGLRVPEDLSVVGFDDLRISRHLSPPLTTVRQPLAQMAAEAVRMTLEASRHGFTSPPPRLELATSLTLRDSTAALH